MHSLCRYVLSVCPSVHLLVSSFSNQGFIHPALARFFWAAGDREPHFGSPYRYCNGTFIVNFDHSFDITDSEDTLGKYLFIDFAGSGLVHLCGKFKKNILSVSIFCHLSIYPFVHVSIDHRRYCWFYLGTISQV